MGEAGRTWRSTLAGACIALAALAALGAVGNAEDTSKTVGGAIGAGSAWKANVSPGKGTGPIPLDDKQLAAVKAIDTYFNAIGDLRGKFLQTDAQQQQQKGEFFIKRPGKFRFVYGSPSKLVIVSDGQTLAFEDYDLKKSDAYPVDSTPFRLLLGKDVNVERDADIKDIALADDLVTVTLQDKSPDSQGQIQLFFAKSGDQLDLKEWVITGPQGDNTRVEIAGIERDKPVDASYFQQADFPQESAKGK